MTRKMAWSLVLIGLSVIILIVNHDRMQVDLLITTVTASESFVLLGFIGVGVAIGLLLK
jgi:hypothetical protein